MRPGPFVFAASFAAACGGSADPCAGRPGQCIAVTLDGTAIGLDQLVVSVDKPTPSTKRTPDPAQSFTLPSRVALLLPSDTTGSVTISVDAMGGGALVARDSQLVALSPSGHSTARLTLNGGGGDLAGNLPGADLATGVVFTGIDPKTAYELDPISIAITAADPSGSTLTLSADNLPTGATFTANGDHGTFTWTPGYADSGAYDVQLTATSSDSSRTSNVTLKLDVLNTVDAVQPNTPPTGVNYLAPVPIGDFDGDGFGDLAFFGANGSSPATHQLELVYGAAQGIPPTSPYPVSRVNQFSYAYDDGVGTTASTLVVLGGDFNGDGKADVIYADSYCVEGGGCNVESGKIALFVVFGNAARTGTPARARLTAASGAHVTARSVRVGDFNGDGRTDVVGSDPGSGKLFLWLGQPGTADVTTPQTYVLPNTPCSYGVMGEVQSTGDLDHDGADDILAWDVNVGQTSATCTAPNGGMVILWGGKNGGLGSATAAFGHPTAADQLWGNGGAVLCDVDHDLSADAVILENSGVHRALVYFGRATAPPLGATSPLMTTGPSLSPIGTAPFAFARCIKNFYGPSTLLLSAPGTSMTDPGEVDLVLGGSRTPTIARSLPNPAPGQKSFGVYVSAVAADVNGDTKADIVIGSGILGSNWVFYGR